MVREDFIKLLTNNGVATLKEVRRLTLNKNSDEVTELDLLEMPHFDENKFAKLISGKYNLTFIDLKNAKVPRETIKVLRKTLVLKYRAIPIQVTNSKVTLATFDPTVITKGSKDLGAILKRPVEFILTNLSSWQKLFYSVEDSVEELIGSIVEIKNSSDTEPEVKAEDIGQDVVTFVNRILAEAFVKKCSDIHIEPYEKIFRVRFRLDGNLLEVAKPPKSIMLPVISRLKIMAGLDISEKRKPQDGRIKLAIGGKPID